MKRKPLLILLLIVSSSQFAKSQITKGSVFLGGQISFNRANTNFEEAGVGDYKNSSFYFSPAIGVVTKDNLVWGGDAMVNLARDYSEVYEPDRKSWEAGAGVFVRKYFEVANRFYLFTQGRFGASYSSEKRTREDYLATARGYLLNLSFYPGISYAIKKNIHLESGFYNLAYINYRHSKTKDSHPNFSNSTSSDFQIGAVGYGQTAFSVGIRFLLPRKSS